MTTDLTVHPHPTPSRPTSTARLAQQFRARFERSRFPQLDVDAAGRSEHVNAALCELLGRPGKDLVGRPAAELCHPDDSGAAAALLARVLRGDQDAGWCEGLLRAGDGSALPVLLDAVVLQDEDGVVTGAAVHLQDLRAVRAAERARQRQDDLADEFARLAEGLAVVGDADGTLLYVSPAVTRLFGYDVVDVVESLGWDFVHPDDLASAAAGYRSVVDTGTSVTMLLRIRNAAGEWRWVEETCHDRRDSSVGGIVCHLVDVTDRVEVEEALRRSELRYRAVAEATEDGIWGVGACGRTRYANARMAEILGVELEELYARSAVDLLGTQNAVRIAQRLDRCSEGGRERFEIDYLHPEGELRELAVSAAPWTDEAGEAGTVALVSDVSQARRAQAQLAAAAMRDWLTGLANRALLLDRLEQLTLRDDATPAVLVVDLDRFRALNDVHGHAVGDELLIAVAGRLRSAAGPQDTVARSGADEFVVVAPHGDEVSGLRLGTRLLDALAPPVELAGGQTLHLAASVGVAVRPGATAGDLLRQADAALQVAKAAGGGRVRLVDPGHADEAQQRLALATDLRAALRTQALEVHYQPIVAIATGEVLGIEALARWEHPERGAVPPDHFVGVAEDAGLGQDLDRFVLQRALGEAGALRAGGHLPAEAFVAVNLSAAHLQDSRLDVLARQWAAAAGIPTRLITLEITETAVMDEPERAIALLRRLRDAGFGIAIDDFGTGYSSLAYLRDLPVTSLKIDRSFVRDVTEHPDARAIAASIVDLSRAVGVGVVAEGVETVAQAALLLRLGCSSAQGWLWSPALTASEVVATRVLRQPFDVDVPTDLRRGTRRSAPAGAAPVLPEHGLERLLELHRAHGASPASIAAALNAEGFRAPSGSRWHRTTVSRALTELAHPIMTQVVSDGR